MILGNSRVVKQVTDRLNDSLNLIFVNVKLVVD